MGFAEFPDKEKKVFASVDEMKDSLHPAARRSLVAPTTMTRLGEVSEQVTGAMTKLIPILETVAAESAGLAAHKDDYSESGYAAATDAIAARGLKKIAPLYQTIGDAEQVASEQAVNFTRDALRSRAMVFHKDPGVNAQIAADKRLRYNTMPSTRLTQETRKARSENDTATAALLEEVIEARDGGPLALSLQQHASAAEYAADFGDGEASIIFAKLEIAAIKARLSIGLVPAREVSRTKIALGLRQQRLAAMEKVQAAKMKAAAK